MLSFNFSDEALGLIAEDADREAWRLVAYLAFNGILETTDEEDDEEYEDYYDEDSDHVASNNYVA